jgi:hypothetical protein
MTVEQLDGCGSKRSQVIIATGDCAALVEVKAGLGRRWGRPYWESLLDALATGSAWWRRRR